MKKSGTLFYPHFIDAGVIKKFAKIKKSPLSGIESGDFII
jgi:hypothetical protein